MKRKVKLDPEEKELLESFESGEWQSVSGIKNEKKRAQAAATKTLRKDVRINIRLSSSTKR